MSCLIKHASGRVVVEEFKDDDVLFGRGKAVGDATRKGGL